MTGILTVTMNPALDLFTTVERVQPTHKLRCASPVVHPGGGGINVARVLARLGADVLALHPAGGITGAQLHALLQAEAVPTQAIAIAGETRESFSVHETASGLDWRFVLPGPTLAEPEWQACLDAAASMQVQSGLAVASGSLPPGVPDDFYARLATRLARSGVRLAVDSSGPALAHALAAGVFLAKPSLRELAEFSGTPLDTREQQLAACRRIIEAGRAEVIALSLGAGGALLATAQHAWFAPALTVPVASTIGAGDSFLAGLVLGIASGEALARAFAHGIAASAAALLTSGTALCQPDDVRRLLPQVQVQVLV
jgi:6-phosphofructokinase 2